MMKKIQSALISVFYKDGLGPLIQHLHQQGVTLYSTGGTQQFIESLGIPCVPVESLTGFPSILGGRVKTLHPAVFGGILGRRDLEQDRQEMQQFQIPEIDLVIVDLYPFEETVASVKAEHPGTLSQEQESKIIEKIDIGGPSMIRAAAKNHRDLTVLASKSDYAILLDILQKQDNALSYEQRRQFAIKAFHICTAYDTAISSYFEQATMLSPFGLPSLPLRYGENPHQQARFYGKLDDLFIQLHGKELSYNNLVDVEAAVQLIREFDETEAVFAIIKHTNVCGIAARATVQASWEAALAGDPESAFGGILVSNREIDAPTAEAISGLFFEVLIAPSFTADALSILKGKKNRILLVLKDQPLPNMQCRSLLHGVLAQDSDQGSILQWKEVGSRAATDEEKTDLAFANIICKHLKSNAIALVKNKQLVGKGCGQTSRVDALRHALEKAAQFRFDLKGAVMASDAFFPFNDCVMLGHEAGISAFIQPGGSVRDQDSVDYCLQHGLAMVMTGMRHFKH